MSALDDSIAAELPTGSDCKTRYIQCIIWKQIKHTDEFVSKHYKKVYNKARRACLDVGKKSRLKGKK